MATVTTRMPNGALSSLAGNVDPHHRVAVADLVLVQGRVRETVERLVRDLEPDVVGLSVMTFQRRTARRIVDLVRGWRPSARVVVGGYDPSLAPEAWTDGTADFIVRGEGEITFRELIRALAAGGPVAGIAGLTWRDGDGYHANPPRPVITIEWLPASLVLTSRSMIARVFGVGRRATANWRKPWGARFCWP
jgi:radical SAM superfamily enzyme YgiQ (UPF0313 family)